jgi:hypothetical protein
MKKLLGFSLVMLIFHSQLSGQISQNESIMTMMNEAESYIMDIEYSNVISKLEFGVVADFYETPVYLIGGKTYNVLIEGERNMIKSLELAISYKPGDEYIVVDKFKDNTNRIKTQFTPEQTTYYYFKITVDQFFSGFSKGGYFIIIYI